MQLAEYCVQRQRYPALWGGGQLRFRALAWLGCALMLARTERGLSGGVLPPPWFDIDFLYANGIVHQRNKRIES